MNLPDLPEDVRELVQAILSVQDRELRTDLLKLFMSILAFAEGR